MASDAAYLTFLLDQLAPLGEVTHRRMMGEYLLYYRGRLFGGIYDNRLLVKDIPAARALLPRAPLEEPYPGAKPMLLVEQVDESAFLCRLVEELEPSLPQPKKKKSKGAN